MNDCNKLVIIIDSMTSVFNTDASLPYKHDLFESLIVKKRVKCPQPGTVGFTRSPSWKASSTDSTQVFCDLLHTPQPSQGLATSLFTPLRIGHGKQYSLRQTMVRHTYHMSQPTQLLVLDTFFNGSTRYTTENTLSNCLVTDSPTPTHTSYGSETVIVEHLKTSQFRCSNRPKRRIKCDRQKDLRRSVHPTVSHSNREEDGQQAALACTVDLFSNHVRCPFETIGVGDLTSPQISNGFRLHISGDQANFSLSAIKHVDEAWQDVKGAM
ncbi:hypothetical protein T265_00804 [Opisthorchis viverrini]|uniref:Uncharacterized protein n=1 Tax=Opisthorchis viverrini TaxID=6198 RepID=A0A075ABT1_OPIVI|nr:hypothetical protein T265_00804 [Opisthorchis viverrini]KER33305.1 hypothetical protein T265_00804 [Opisthorchis viverrini]